MNDDQTPPRDPTDEQPVPSEKPAVLDYSTLRTSPTIHGTMLVTIRRMPLFEADLARVKLQAEGIPAFVADANLSVIHPLLMNLVQLQVPEADVQLAEEVLSRPAAISADGADGDYADEDWRCPKCHRREVDLLPLSRPWRWVRNGLISAVISALLLGVFQAMLDRDQQRMLDPYLSELLWLCVIAAPVFALSLLFAHRTKRCRTCGQEWQKGGQAI